MVTAKKNDEKKNEAEKPRKTVRYHGKTYTRAKSLMDSEKNEACQLDEPSEHQPKKMEQRRLQTRKEYYKTEEYKKVCRAHWKRQREAKARIQEEQHAAEVKGAFLLHSCSMFHPSKLNNRSHCCS
jgi:hypothetical protein